MSLWTRPGIACGNVPIGEEINPPYRAIFVNVDCEVVMRSRISDSDVTFVLLAGTLLPVACAYVTSTTAGTPATDLIGIA